MSKENVNHPSHYRNSGKCQKCGESIEVIVIIENYNFCIGNSLKYIMRAGLKQEEGMDSKQKQIEDYKKAIWYIQREIHNLEKEV